MNNNVVSINRKRNEKFSGFSAYSENEQRRLKEEKFLLAGAIVTPVLFQIICIAVFNFPQSALFAGSALIGVIAGLATHYFFPAQIKSYFDLRESPLTTPIGKSDLRRAA